MIRHVAQWLLVLALSFSIGLQWALLQTAAWVGMVVTYSQEAALSQAVAMTFDGKHPCRICKSVQKESAGQKKQEVRGAVLKLEFPAPEMEQIAGPRHVFGRMIAEATPVLPMRGILPLTPPPERAA